MEMPARQYIGNEYRYGYNGKEKINDISGEGNAYDLGERIYNSRIGKLFSPDPDEVKYPWQSPYAYYKNSPISIIDYLGLGDYYKSDGTHLGSDNKSIKNKKGKMVPDDKAYVAEGMVTSEDGKISFTNAAELSVSNSTLNKLANTVAQESSGDQKESFGIASTITNLANYKGQSILKTLETQKIYGYGNGGNNTSYKNNNKYSMSAAINALTGGVDYSNGAIRWDGDDFGRKGFSHIKAKADGVEISADYFELYKAVYTAKYSNFSKNLSSGIHVATIGNIGRVLYKAVAVHGRTIFWGQNTDPIKYFPPVIRDFMGENKGLIIHPNAGYNFKQKGL